MSFIDRLISKIAPHECLCCGVEGRLLCKICISKLPVSLPRCYRCQKPSEASLTCIECLEASPLLQVESATTYGPVAKKLIWKFKSSGAQAAAGEMASAMQGLLKESRERGVIVSVPTATSRVRQRGFDQTRLVARKLARRSRLPWIDCLKRVGQAHQVGSSRDHRLKQTKNALRITQKRFIKGADIVLVDDVVTTGATLESAAKILHAAGAISIRAITFAQA